MLGVTSGIGNSRVIRSAVPSSSTHSGSSTFPQHPDEFIPVRLRHDRIEALAIEHSHALKTAGLPYHHRDPFDRLLVAQAMVLDIPIMTADPAFDPYEIEVIPPVTQTSSTQVVAGG